MKFHNGANLKHSLISTVSLPSTLFHHENGAFRKPSSNRRNLKTQAFHLNSVKIHKVPVYELYIILSILTFLVSSEWCRVYVYVWTELSNPF